MTLSLFFLPRLLGLTELELELELQQGPVKDRRFLMRITRCKVNRALYVGQRVQEDPPIGRILQRY